MSPEKLAEMIRMHGPALVLYARQICSAEEDVVQEAFIELMRRDRLPANPVAWLYRVVRNRAINAGRSERRRWRREHEYAIQNIDWFDRSDEQNETIDAGLVAKQLVNLPADLREIIVARIWGQLTLKEIADNMQLSIATVHRRWRQALEMIRASLEIEYEKPAKDQNCE